MLAREALLPDNKQLPIEPVDGSDNDNRYVICTFCNETVPLEIVRRKSVQAPGSAMRVIPVILVQLKTIVLYRDRLFVD